jgi:pimeloyl-ACP methyl ester carboxylesterase
LSSYESISMTKVFICLETDVNFRSRKIQTRTLLLLSVMAVAFLLAQAQFTLAAEVPKGAQQLLQPARPSPLERLPSEQTAPHCAALAEANATLPDKLLLLNTRRAGEPDFRIAVHQRSTGTHERVLVLIHGVLADNSAWRLVVGQLANEFDLWVVDLPGCGASDKPDPTTLRPDGYSPTAMGDRVLQALEQCLAQRSERTRIVIAAHSLGGMMALRMIGDPDLRNRFPNVRKRVDGLALFAPCDVAVNHEIKTFTDIAELRGWEASVGSALGLLQERIAASDARGYCNLRCATRESSAILVRMLSNRPERRATQAMVKQAVPWNFKEHRPNWDAIEKLEAHYKNIDVPCVIVWGQRDEMLPVAMGYKLQAQIPNAKLIVLPQCMHSIPVECPAASANILRDFDGMLVTKTNLPSTFASMSAQFNERTSTLSINQPAP